MLDLQQFLLNFLQYGIEKKLKISNFNDHFQKRDDKNIS